MSGRCVHGVAIYNPCPVCIEQETGFPYMGSTFVPGKVNSPTVSISHLESENQALKARVGKLEDVVLAARNASREIQAQKVNWPGEVDTLADALAELDKE